MRRKVILRKNSIVVILRNNWGEVYRFRLLGKHLKTQTQFPSPKKIMEEKEKEKKKEKTIK